MISSSNSPASTIDPDSHGTPAAPSGETPASAPGDARGQGPAVALSPLQQALRQFVQTHPGLTTRALAEAFGLPPPQCAEQCALLRDAGQFVCQPDARWYAAAADQHTQDRELPANLDPRHLAMLFEQSLDGLFFMMLDEPVRWDDDVDKEQVLDQVFEHQRTTHVNDAMCRQYAAQPQQLLGLRPGDFFAHDLAEGRRQWRRLFDTGRLHTETDERRFDGTPIFIEGDYRCLYDHHGRILGHFGVQRDMTERKLAQRQLAESEARLQDIIASTADFIWEVDTQGRFRFVAGQVEELLGYRSEELLGKTPFELMDPDEAARIQAVVESARVERRALGKHQNWLNAKNGDKRCFAFAGVPMFDDHGQVTGFRGLNRDITERKRSDDALRHSEQRLRMLFEMSPESILILDPETTLPLHFNRVAHERLGYSAEEFARVPIAEYDATEDARDVRTHVEKIRKHGRDDFETRHRCRDGRLLNIIVSVQSTEIDGRPVLYAMFRDVTELRSLSERLVLATSAGGIGIWAWTINASTLSWDEQMYRLYGLPPGDGEEPYARWLLALHPQDRPRMEREVQQVLETGVDLNSEFRILIGDEVRWLRVAAHLVRDTAGRPIKMIGCNWDVSEPHQAEERMARSEAQFRGAFAIAPNGMALVDAEGRWLQVNQALCEMLGYSAAELLALDFQSISHPDDLAADFVYLDSLLSGRADQVQIDKRYLHKTGHDIPVLVSASAVRDDQGELSFMVAHLLDLSERRASEAAMLAAKEAAEAANRAKSEFLANMSHEIRTPLNAMIGLTELTLDTELDQRQRDYLSKVRQSSRALLGILNDILDYAKIEAGRIELDQAQFRLEELLEQLSALFSSAADSKGLELFYRISPEVPRELIGDPMRIGQVLNNLVGNAVKFTEQGSVELSIGVAHEHEDRIELKFAVRDSGIGMAPGIVQRLFQAFTQADSSITRRYGGTGLGLTISQRLVLLMGGSIQVESEEGHGSVFRFNSWFKLPASTPQRVGAPPRPLEQRHVLIIDDRPVARRLLADILTSWRMEVTEADSCHSATRALAQATADGKRVDIVMLDIRSCQACHECKVTDTPPAKRGIAPKMFGAPATPIILQVSCAEHSELLTQASAADLPQLLVKPVTPSALFDAIASMTVDASETDRANALANKTANAQLVEAPAEAGASMRGKRILVAEDNPINQMVVRELLTKAGYQAVIAGNGREAVDLVCSQPFDAVLMDLQMPIMDGFSATAAIRAQHPKLPIIALTAAAFPADRERCLAAGMNDHLGKPIQPKRLIEALTHWIESAPETSAHAPAEAAIPVEQIDQLRELLVENDYVPPELLADLRDNAPPQIQQAVANIEHALAQFDYEAALKALDRLLASAESGTAKAGPK
ncbi:MULTISPECIES: PAS domain-containing hybrid sensor histidine kinase/response regulator [Thiorhodovibrio]|uniref:PAS domain-containing hybrid sensor histidine kinase/response regulator n=1 Tax=Thiorhodovibrio TaxID=61593 RepID=UPI001912376D|nr:MULTISPECIES: PAS domain-containing hybrid sensor histidine kinase/response regulator [Thiorhodovibrio]MBK5971269.1 hypothetical protein [Thiorhodovibrio winogradskyi]WPL13907.1 Signal transduction histidine-protein kinase BarA [Thiorhodovibrio litoralis]